MAKSNYEVVKAWRKQNPDKRAAQDKRYRERHPETNRKSALKYRAANLDKVRDEEASRARAKRRNDPEGQRIRNARFRAKREADRVRIAGRPRPEVCDICDGNHHLGIVFDHCHASGRFRGWLCDRCNKTLGLVKDDVGLLMKLANYLEIGRGKVDVEGEKCATG
jgi:hypothetical protein